MNDDLDFEQNSGLSIFDWILIGVMIYFAFVMLGIIIRVLIAVLIIRGRITILAIRYIVPKIKLGLKKLYARYTQRKIEYAKESNEETKTNLERLETEEMKPATMHRESPRKQKPTTWSA